MYMQSFFEGDVLHELTERIDGTYEKKIQIANARINWYYCCTWYRYVLTQQELIEDPAALYQWMMHMQQSLSLLPPVIAIGNWPRLLRSVYFPSYRLYKSPGALLYSNFNLELIAEYNVFYNENGGMILQSSFKTHGTLEFSCFLSCLDILVCTLNKGRRFRRLSGKMGVEAILKQGWSTVCNGWRFGVLIIC